MIRFFCGLSIAIYFFTWVDILIWQRIFEANQLWDLGIGIYHKGWTYALFGFMALGVLFFYPNIRRMLTFPLSLGILAFSGIEDILYYWFDGRTIPHTLIWLNDNPLIFLKPVTSTRLITSALIWLLVVIIVEIVGNYLDRRFIIAWRSLKRRTKGRFVTWPLVSVFRQKPPDKVNIEPADSSNPYPEQIRIQKPKRMDM